ncbi:MAG: hypothetical protein RIS94_2607 [Pseudomonadota bacterium]|jgi:pyruvate dehydrogenase complex dehydrogenase (E1) component
MINLRESSARLVAGDAQEMGGMIDRALLQQMRLATSFIEASSESKLAMPLTQPALAELAGGLNALVEGRSRIAASVREMNRLLKHSNLAETAFGCPNGLYMTLSPARDAVPGPEGVPAF